jgi:hypothetical protein
MVARASLVWLGLRAAMLALAGTLSGAGGASVDLYSSVLIIVVTVALVLWDGRRRNEHLFLANLGVPLRALAIIAALPPLVLEMGLSLADLPW